MKLARRLAAMAWPGPDERRLMGRFYVAIGLSRALYLIFPFQFAYLYLAMDAPAWAVIPLMAASATSLAMQLPTGALADRWSRKASVLLGGALTAVAMAAVPWAVRLPGGWQLAMASVAFSVSGLGETMMAGAQEAWVVDNLHRSGRKDLVDAFFARAFAVTAAGGVVAGALALVLLVTRPVDRGLLDLLWYATGAGFVVAVGVAAGIREERVEPATGPGGEPVAAIGLWRRMGAAVVALVRRRSLLLLTVAVVIAALSGAAADEAFPVALLTKGLDARVLAPLGIAGDLLGAVAPVVGLMLARRIGPEPLLTLTMVAIGLSVSVLFAWRSLGVVIVLFVLLGFLDQIWDPVSLARMQDDIPSEHRAAMSSIVYQANGLAQLVGLGLFALLLGQHGAQLRDATPDLIDAFSGHTHVNAPVPTGLLGLPVPDLAVLVFVLAGVAAIPFVVLSTRARRRAGSIGGPTGGSTGGPAGVPTGGPGAAQRAERPCPEMAPPLTLNGGQDGSADDVDGGRRR